MTKLECCICLELFLDSDLAERACCLDKICRPCLETSPKCLDCPNLPTMTVNLSQLEAEIQLVNEIGQEQADFYDRWDCDNIHWLNRYSDAKAISLVLELLEFLRHRLVLSMATNPNKNLLMPLTSLIRSKDVYHGIVINSHGILKVDCDSQREFFESHRICYSWSHTIPTPAKYLRDLNLAYSRVGDFSGLADLRLIKLSLYQTLFHDLSVLKGMTSLTYLDISDTKVTDLTPLRGLALTKLYLNGTKVADITALAGMPLVKLDLSRTNVTDLRPLAGMPLVELNLYHTEISNISVLKDMSLEDLDLRRTKVVDYSPVEKITELVLRRD